MIVRDLRDKGYPGYGDELNVYAIYWVDEKIYYLCSPYRYDGLMAYSTEDIEVVDNSLSSFRLCMSGDGSNILIHKIIDEADLLDDLIEYDPEAYKKFVTLLGDDP